MARIDYDELRKLERLLDDKIIDQDEYNAKVSQMCSIAEISQTTTKPDTRKKRNPLLTILLTILSGVLFVGCIYYYSNSKLLTEELSEYSSENAKLEASLSSYKNAIITYYLDKAVFVIDSDDTYYHRCKCVTFPEDYTYWIYNVEAARDRGYVECAACFTLDNYVYIENKF